MSKGDANIYRIDDIFIRVGYTCLVLFVLITGTIVSKTAQGEPLANPGSLYGGAAMLGVPALLFLVIGYAVRRREKTAAAVLGKLQVAPEVAAGDLMSATGLSRGLLDKAIATINRRNRGFYVWDRETDLIADTRLRQGMVLVETCDRCGARIGKSYPLSTASAPLCPYCGNPLSADGWNDMRRAVMKELMESGLRQNLQEPSSHGRGRQPSFSVPLFVVLLLLFWPAALVYALTRYGSRS